MSERADTATCGDRALCWPGISFLELMTQYNVRFLMERAARIRTSPLNALAGVFLLLRFD